MCGFWRNDDKGQGSDAYFRDEGHLSFIESKPECFN